MSRKLDLRCDDCAVVYPFEAKVAITGISDAQLLPGGLFVKPDATDNFQMVVAGVGDEPAGVLNCNVAAGAIGNVSMSGPARVTLGATVAEGAYVEVDSASKAITATGLRPIAGQLLTGGVAGEVAVILLGKLPSRPLIGGVIVAFGSAALVAGTKTIATTAVKTGDKIFLTRILTGGTVGHLSVGTITDATSFVIDASVNTDTSTVAWMIVR